MFSDPNLDAPPPPSQFRRPWSPDPYDHYASSSSRFNELQNTYHNRQEEQGHRPRAHGTSPHRQQRREASDVSVEALDLADYARTLRIRQAEDPYPPFPSQIQQQGHYPPSSFPLLSQPAHSQDSLAMHPPSLVSHGPTLSSNSTHYTLSSSAPSRARHPAQRPFSMPTTPYPSSQGNSSRVRHDTRGPYIMDPDNHPEEIDISNFPKWSRGWYNPNNSSAARHNSHPANAPGHPDADIYTALPGSHFDSIQPKQKSPFDPGYIHDPYNSFHSDPYDIPPPLSLGPHDSREVLPWSNDPPDYGPPLDPMLKEERMRMLEREFGGKGTGKSKDAGKAWVDEDGKPLVGTIDKRGRLVTTGPKRRVIFRTLQILLAIGACVPAIYAAVAIKPKDAKNPPPPANKPPVFVLYFLSSITLLLLLYMFVVRRCCCVCAKSRSSSKHPLGAAANMGMMVLPISDHGKKNKKAKGGRKGRGKYGPAGQGDVHVNLIVDPKAFQPPGASESDLDDEDYDSLDEAMPGGYDDRQNHARRKRRNRNRRRRGVFEGLAMEEEWRVARAWAKKVAMVDVAGIVLWGAAFVFIMTGKRCPSGGYEGWCNAYNASTACACLLAVAFSVSTFFDVQDLHASKQSPRTRS